MENKKNKLIDEKESITIEVEPKVISIDNSNTSDYLEKIELLGKTITEITTNSKLNLLMQNIGEIINPFLEISKNWTKNYNTIIKGISNILESLKNIPSFDFSNIDKIIEETCVIMLENGFYSYRRMGLSICYIRKVSSKYKIIDEISSMLEIDIINNKKILKKTFVQYKGRIDEIYRLYNNKKYRLCILAQLNFLSVVFNRNFDNKDFADKNLYKKLEELKIIDDVNLNYCQFIPYIIDKDKKRSDINYKNTLLVSYQNNPERYKEIPYNRNAILHGYSKDFGTKLNCLRWFSVMLNTLDLFEIYNKLEEVR